MGDLRCFLDLCSWGKPLYLKSFLLLFLINYRTIAKVNGFYLLENKKKEKKKKKTSFRVRVLVGQFYKVKLITSDANDPCFVRFHWHGE